MAATTARQGRQAAGNTAEADSDRLCSTHTALFSFDGPLRQLTPPFEAAGCTWQLQVLRGHRRHQLSIYLVAVSGVFPETRTKVSFDPCVWHRAKGWVSHTDLANLKFSPRQSSWGIKCYKPLKDLDSPDYLNSNRELKVLARISMPYQVATASGGSPPKASIGGDVQLILDDGTVLCAHASRLEQASAALKATLAGSGAQASEPQDTPADAEGPQKRQRAMVELPVPGVFNKQALLLLHCLYSSSQKIWLGNRAPPQLMDLARIASSLGCSAVVQGVDKALVKACQYAVYDVADEDHIDSCSWEPDYRNDHEAESGWVNVRDAPAQFRLARELQLTKFEAHVGRFMGMHAPAMDLKQLDAGTAAILQGAQVLHGRMDVKFKRQKYGRDWWDHVI